mmetsp:Transcript_11436/g.53193  ORF Transcript_11436/g.53193 Transcript_11436/m.53193 type:complete len:312 (+) Transcript_11436:312-1247(+)
MAADTFPNVACSALMFCASSKKPMSFSCCSCDAYASSGGRESAAGIAGIPGIPGIPPPINAANGFAAPAAPGAPPGMPPGGITPLPWSCAIARCICIIARRLSGLVIRRRNSGSASCSRMPGAESSMARIRGSESIICCITCGLDIIPCIMLAIAGLLSMASICAIICSGFPLPPIGPPKPPIPAGIPPRPGKPPGAGAAADPAPVPALGAHGLGSGDVFGLPPAPGAAFAAGSLPGTFAGLLAPKRAAKGLSAPPAVLPAPVPPPAVLPPVPPRPLAIAFIIGSWTSAYALASALNPSGCASTLAYMRSC